ncbi:MAG: bifunctional precorrin-2 dehydrogenase/sirohydrochlorin ferrochelatase [bacterium]
MRKSQPNRKTQDDSATYFPVFLRLTGEPLLIVGGGQVALRKLEKLLVCKPKVTVVGREIHPQIKKLARSKSVILRERKFQKRDVEGRRAVIVATDDANLQKEIAALCRKRGILCNVVDVPELCTFIAPAVVTRGGLQIAISTGGASPSFAGFVRRQIETLFDETYEPYLRLIGKLRSELQEKQVGAEQIKNALTKLYASQMFEILRSKGPEAAERYARKLLGSG